MNGTTALSIAEQNALSVKYEVRGVMVELDMDFAKRQLVRGRAEFVTDQEILFFINTCRSQGLDPRVYGDVYLIKYSKDDPAQMVVGKDAYMRRAYEHPEYLYKQDGITVKRGDQIVQKEGCCVYPGEELLGGWCKVYFERAGKERVTFKEVAFSEYNKGMANWKSKPATMINKVAISQCAREAFPKDFEGLYSEEELVASGAIPVEYTEVTAGKPTQPEDDPPITQEQRQELFKKAKSRFGKKANDTLGRILAEFGLSSTTDMPTSVWVAVMVRTDEWEDEAPHENDETP